MYTYTCVYLTCRQPPLFCKAWHVMQSWEMLALIYWLPPGKEIWYDVDLPQVEWQSKGRRLVITCTSRAIELRDANECTGINQLTNSIVQVYWIALFPWLCSYSVAPVGRCYMYVHVSTYLTEIVLKGRQWLHLFIHVQAKYIYECCGQSITCLWPNLPSSLPPPLWMGRSRRTKLDPCTLGTD